MITFVVSLSNHTQPFDKLRVNGLANGDVMACCVPGSKMGNLNEQSFEVIWQGKAYQQLRAKVNSVNPPSICKSCQFRNSLNSYNSESIACNNSAIPLFEELNTEMLL